MKGGEGPGPKRSVVGLSDGRRVPFADGGGPAKVLRGPVRGRNKSGTPVVGSVGLWYFRSPGHLSDESRDPSSLSSARRSSHPHGWSTRFLPVPTSTPVTPSPGP